VQTLGFDLLRHLEESHQELKPLIVLTPSPSPPCSIKVRPQPDFLTCPVQSISFVYCRIQAHKLNIMALPVKFAPPLHHVPEGPTDPSKVKLSSPFVVVVAGSSQGIGLGIAQAYATAGASGIVIASRTSSSLETAAKTLHDINPNIKVHCQTCDVVNEEDVKALAARTKEVFGRLDVLVINAGTSAKLSQQRNGLKDWPRGLIEEPPSEFERLWKVNVYGPYLLQHHFLPLLEDSKDGAQAIIQLSSAASLYVDPQVMPTSYSLTKFACTRLIQHAHEGHRSNGVVAYAIQPGGVKTDMATALPEGKGWEKCEFFNTTDCIMTGLMLPPVLIDDVGLAGGFCVWLTKEKRSWLSGRYLDSRWDMDELLRRKDEIVEKDMLKLKMDC
jgi:NAD(P)-dependent dehydrogenase (short-subunit alcohol dehydrogenase family)